MSSTLSESPLPSSPKPSSQPTALAAGPLVISQVDCCDLPGFANHELVVKGVDPSSGLQAFIAIHDTQLGPALGGCRLWTYADESAAITDALRLSEGMSYKHAVAETGRGGGKAVIMRDPRTPKSPALFWAFGRLVDSLQGRYTTAEDVGVSVQDLTMVRETTSFVAGLPLEQGGSGDPSPFTAWGVFCGLQAAVRFHLHRADLQGVVVAVQGVGHVGYSLCQHLHEAGARLIVADMQPENLRRVKEQFQAQIVDVDQICDAQADVFAPCALGGSLNALTTPRLKCRVVAGAANNQLAAPEIADLLRQRDILWAPDYVINAGGIINISYEGGPYDPQAAREHTSRIGEVLIEIFAQAKASGRTTAAIADDLAQSRLHAAAKK